MKIDHHIHTSRYSPDSTIRPEELVRHACEIGLDGIVITEHDYQWQPDELAELAARAPACVSFPGPKSRRTRGTSWCTACPRSKRRLRESCADLLEVVRRHDAAIVAAHPFRWDQPFDQIIAEHGPAFDALELVSNNVYRGYAPQNTGGLEQFPMGATGSSDAHEIDVRRLLLQQVPRPDRDNL